MFCPNCGNALAAGARFCSKCGTLATRTTNVSRVTMERPGLVTTLAVLHFLGAAFMLLAAFGTFASLNDKDAIGAPFGVLFLVMGILSVFTGIGLWRLKGWGRILQIVLASIGLLALPLGTIISALRLVYFTRPGVEVLFSGKSLNVLSPEEVTGMQGTSGSSGATVAVVAVVALVAVAILGIFSAIAIPNLLTAMQRSKQKRTIADMRAIALKIEEYKASQKKLPVEITAVSPTAKLDGWGTPLLYTTDGTNYWLVSAGKDAKFETEKPQEYVAGTTTNFNADIVLQNGELLQAPEGMK